MMVSRRSSRQQPLFPVQMFQPQPLVIGSVFHVLYEYGEYLIRHTDFPASDPALGGHVGWCPILLTKLVLLQKHHGWSEREAVRRARMDMEVKACLNLGLEQTGPSQSTLCRHAQRMQSLGLDEVYQQRQLELLEALGLLSVEDAVLVDSVPIRGAGQQLDSYNLLAGGVRNGLRVLAKAQGRSVEDLAQEHGLRAYLDRSIKGSFKLDWSDETARTEVLRQIVADARRVQKLLDDAKTERQGCGNDNDQPPGALNIEEAQTTIEEIISHDVEFNADDEVIGIRQTTAGDRRISLTDSDMRHGRKSASQVIAGYKAQLIASLVYGFILVVRVIAANRHDGADLPALVEDVEARGLKPAWWGGDHAYGTIANHRYFRDSTNGELIARMSRPTNGGRFTKDMFNYDFESHVLTCPAGQKAPLPRWKTVHGRVGRRFDFTTEQCGGCPLREQSVSPKAKKQRRSVFIVDDDERLIREHLKKRETEQFRDRSAKRVGVEHAIAGFAQCGGKQARRFGIESVGFDANLSAFTYNLRRLGSLLRKSDIMTAKLNQIIAAFCRRLSDLPGLRALTCRFQAHLAPQAA